AGIWCHVTPLNSEHIIAYLIVVPHLLDGLRLLKGERTLYCLVVEGTVTDGGLTELVLHTPALTGDLTLLLGDCLLVQPTILGVHGVQVAPLHDGQALFFEPLHLLHHGAVCILQGGDHDRLLRDAYTHPVGLRHWLTLGRLKDLWVHLIDLIQQQPCRVRTTHRAL